MNLKIRIKLYFCIIVYSALGTVQLHSQSYTDTYDLSFKMKDSFIVYPWLENAAYSLHTIPSFVIDTNRKLFCRKYFKGFPFSDRLRTEYGQRILLPFIEESSISIEFECKGKNIHEISIYLEGINKQEVTVFYDTLKFTPDSILSIHSTEIDLVDIELLDIRINVEGEIETDAYIAFSKVNIVLGGKSIDKYPVRKLQRPLKIKMNCLHIIDAETAIEKIFSLDSNKIIGIGESCHGNNDIKDLIYKLIIKTVESDKLKLILFEMPLEQSLKYNRYICDKNYVFDTLTLVDERLNQLINKLRKYNLNKNAKEKVKLFGIDYNRHYSTTQNTAIDIFDFVSQVNKDIRLSEVDQFALLLMKNWNQAINYLETNKKEISKVLTEDEIDCISHILKLSYKMESNLVERFILRDSVMFINVDFLYKKYNKENSKALIFAHAVHINTVSTFPAIPCISLGKYLQSIYMSDYIPLLVTSANGQSAAYDENFDVESKKLKNAPANSLEFLLDSYNSNNFYIPLTSEFDRLLLSRFKGSHHTQQEFYPYNIYQRFRGVFFVESSKYENNEQKKISFANESNRHIMNIKRRKTILSEIEERINAMK